MVATTHSTAAEDSCSPQRVLVTGCAGFMGSKVAEYRLADGWAVVGIDSLDDGYDMRLKTWSSSSLQP